MELGKKNGVIFTMEQITNDNTTRECSKVLGHQVENAPQLDTSKIMLVAEVNPKMLRRSNIVKNSGFTNNTSVNVYTTPTDRFFYLTSAVLSYIKDVTSTSTSVRLNATINGVVTQLIPLPTLTLTAGQDSLSVSYSNAIRIDPGTTITATSTTNVANITVNTTITGYLDESISNL
jgi:hypothetical protein